MNSFKANKLHIGIFGRRNSGKSTIMNLLLNQDFSIVSNTLGTTTDVNQKSVEIPLLGPVVLMDTAGIDDYDELGKKRVEKTLKAFERTDIALYVIDKNNFQDDDKTFLSKLKDKKIPTIIIFNKTDLGEIKNKNIIDAKAYFESIIKISANDKKSKDEIIKNILKIVPDKIITPMNALYDIINEGDNVILVIPTDKEAPKDRLILPQVQILRNVLDKKAMACVCDVKNLKTTLENLKHKPKLVITDSQAFLEVSKIVDNDIPLTSFSILFARLKGDLKEFVKGSDVIDNLGDNDKILICESCSHHAIEDDIARVKIPNIIQKYTGKKLYFETYSGYDFPKDIEKYKLIIHCGACMTNRREILNRIMIAKEKNVPITNFGIAISKCLNILPRAIKIFD